MTPPPSGPIATPSDRGFRLFVRPSVIQVGNLRVKGFGNLTVFRNLARIAKLSRANAQISCGIAVAQVLQ